MTCACSSPPPVRPVHLMAVQSTAAVPSPSHSELLSATQNYVDSFYVCGGEDKAEAEGEDSSYDSDAEVEVSSTSGQSSHHDVSRTASDTLAAEYADYVSSPQAAYIARVEFALKLGYTERQVQAALQKLGPNPGQNELLAELIKLGAQTSPRLGSESDSGLIASDDLESCAGESQLVTSTAVVSDTEAFRPIVIDGSNVAMSHGNKEVFSCRGIKLCVDWFRARGHKEITVFVPKWRKEASRPDNPITDQEILNELERERLLVFTPSRLVGGKRMICYDDRYILRLAVDVDGIVVSNDNYRDLAQENPEFRRVVEERILMYSFVNDRFMPPDDPLGRSGPTLDNFLRLQPNPPPPCPYAKKCTYGNKCKFHHPERGPLPHKSVTERLVEHAQRQLQARGRDRSPGGNQVKGKSLSLPLQPSCTGTSEVCDIRKTPLSRTKSNVSVGDPPGGLDAFRSPPPGYPPVYTAWPHQPPTSDGSTLHRKLQRQLTLNPVCDPRLYQLQRFMAEHPSVTRIASAPPAHPSHTPHPSTATLLPRNMTSASDPQLNLSAPPPHIQTTWSSCLGPPPPHGPQMSACQYPGPSNTDEARRRLHYHLASIFPEEQVQTVMQLYPNETNPQKICAAILAMFPTNQALV